MHPQTKAPEPVVLSAGKLSWTQKYVAARVRNPGHAFRWPQVQGKPLNQHLIGPLRKSTGRHCSYCDGFPVPVRSAETIDHFEPKTKRPNLAFEWSNLFYCCTRCQKRLDEVGSVPLLKPDEHGFRFEKYFVVNYETGELEVRKKGASARDRQRARDTIDVLRLNLDGLPEDRLQELKNFENSGSRDVERWSYRFLYR